MGFLINKRKDKHLKELFHGSFIAFVLKGLGLIAGYGFSLLITSSYGAKGYGVYGLTLSVLTVLGIASTLGFHLAILRLIPQWLMEGKTGNVRLLYKKLITIIIPLSIVIAFLFYSFSNIMALNLFHNSLMTRAFQLIGMVIPFFILSQINIETIRAFKDVKRSEFFRYLHTPLLSILLFILLGFILSSPYISIISYSWAVILLGVVSSYIVIKKLGGLSKQPEGEFSIKALFELSSPMMLTAFMNLIIGNIDTLILGIYSTAENIGIYQIALKLASLTVFFLNAVNTIITSLFSELFWSGNMEGLKKIVHQSSKVLFWSSATILLIYLMFPEVILGIFGSEFKSGKNALLLLATGQFLSAWAGPVGPFLNMTGKQKILRNILIFATLINVILDFLLIPRYGFTGAAIASSTTIVLWNLLSVIYIKSVYQIKTFYVPFTRMRRV